MTKILRVAALIDLPRSRLSGGHVKGWEKRARAVARMNLPLDLTVYFSGPENTEDLAPHVRLRQLPPVFSTAALKFLPYVPDHTDLAPYHAKLAKELAAFDVIHTTDAYFAFSKTADRIHKKYNTPIVTSFHTDTPAYARVFTRKTIETIFGKSFFAKFLTDSLLLPEKQEEKMIRKLRSHLKNCAQALVIRDEDRAISEELIGKNHVHIMKQGIDKGMFGPHRKDRAGIERDYNIPENKIIVLFVGRLDEGKNIYTLIDAIEKLIQKNLPIHLITAGVGPAEETLRTKLAHHVTLAGFVDPIEIARLYASVDMLALCSEVEIRSLAGMEALVSGTPVLVSEKSEIAPLFDNTPAMEVVSGGVLHWAEAIESLALDENKRRMMRHEAIIFSDAKVLSWEDVMEHDFYQVWKQAYDESVKSK